MFSKSTIRSRKQIIKGLLTRAYNKSQEAGERMELLIEWRLAACRHANRKALRAFESNFKINDMRGHVSSGSRGIDAFNWLAIIEGRDDRLVDEHFEARIREMERMHHISRFFKNSQIVVDLEALEKAAARSNPDAPIFVELPSTQTCQRHENDIVYTKSYEEPAYMKSLPEIEAQIEGDHKSSSRKIKKPDNNELAFLQIPKSKFDIN